LSVGGPSPPPRSADTRADCNEHAPQAEDGDRCSKCKRKLRAAGDLADLGPPERGGYDSALGAVL